MDEFATKYVGFRVDTGEAISGIEEIEAALTKLEKTTGSISAVITSAFSPFSDNVQALENDVTALNESMKKLSEKFLEVKEAGTVKTDSQGLFSGISEAYTAVTQGLKKVEEFDKYSGKINQIFEEFVTAPNMGAMIEGIFPKSSELMASIGDWTNNIFGKSLVENLTKISPVLGTVADSMLKSITGVFSKIGSALGGMSVGWGLVIAAVVAGVIVIIQNWDTIKAAIGRGAEWFNTNMIQPLVGFFTGLWDRICLIVTNVTTFISTKFQEFTLWIQTAIANVQAVFMGIDAFLLGVFATDWTNQFGAFGEVLNAFFANVENIWNAVKTIFNGIVEFVKGVFAGDWQKGCQREAVCFRKCCKGAMLPKVDDPRRRGVYLKKD